jgi:hypothetical protein
MNENTYTTKEISSIISSSTIKNGDEFVSYFTDKKEYTSDEIAAVISEQTILDGNNFKVYFE